MTSGTAADMRALRDLRKERCLGAYWESSVAPESQEPQVHPNPYGMHNGIPCISLDPTQYLTPREQLTSGTAADMRALRDLRKERCLGAYWESSVAPESPEPQVHPNPYGMHNGIPCISLDPTQYLTPREQLTSGTAADMRALRDLLKERCLDAYWESLP